MRLFTCDCGAQLTIPQGWARFLCVLCGRGWCESVRCGAFVRWNPFPLVVTVGAVKQLQSRAQSSQAHHAPTDSG